MRKAIVVTGIVFAIATEVALAVILLRQWSALSAAGIATASQAVIAALLGWPTLIFAVAATYAYLRSAKSSEDQVKVARQQVRVALIQTRTARRQNKLLAATLKEQRRARRLETEPFLLVEFNSTAEDEIDLSVINFGGGLAFKVRGWLEVNRAKDKFDTIVARDPDSAFKDFGHIRSKAKKNLKVHPIRPWGGDQLYILSCLDPAGRHFQHHLLIEAGGTFNAVWVREPLQDFETRVRAETHRWDV